MLQGSIADVGRTSFPRFMRAAAAVVAAASVAAAQGQGVAPSKPDAIIRVQKSSVGPDYVRIQMVPEDYPADLLRSQIEALGRYSGGTPRGLDLQYATTGAKPEGKEGRILTAEFAVDNLINRTAGTLEIEAFAKAFAGAPEPHEVDRLRIMFEGETPIPNVTLASWPGDTAEVEANFDETIPAVEYSILLKSQDPEKIYIPKTAQEQTKPVEKPSNEKPKTEMLPWVIAGAVVVGVLVYFALRPSNKAARRRE